jgi:Holliday junction resolvase RusA-like endonuclease
LLKVKPVIIVTIVVRGKPVSYKRVSDWTDPATGQIRKLSDKKGRHWRSEIKDKFEAVVFNHPRTTDLLAFFPSDHPVRVNMTSFFATRKAGPQWLRGLELRGEVPCERESDWDNIGKNVCDALEGLAYTNDKRIFSGTSEKFWSRNPRISITFEFYPEITRENWDLDFMEEKEQTGPIVVQMDLDLPEGIDNTC